MPNHSRKWSQVFTCQTKPRTVSCLIARCGSEVIGVGRQGERRQAHLRRLSALVHEPCHAQAAPAFEGPLGEPPLHSDAAAAAGRRRC